MFHVERTEVFGIVVKEYSIQYSDPITLQVSDVVLLGEEEKEEKWKGWIWAETVHSKQKGWIPMAIVLFSEDKKTGIIQKEYSAQEVDAKVNDTVQILEELNGWFWIINKQSHKQGWIPAECVQIKKL